jgi:hypothetical protein
MILPPLTPGLTDALEYNAQVIAAGGIPDSLGIPSTITSDEDLDRLDAIANGVLIIELEERQRRSQVTPASSPIIV